MDLVGCLCRIVADGVFVLVVVDVVGVVGIIVVVDDIGLGVDVGGSFGEWAKSCGRQRLGHGDCIGCECGEDGDGFLEVANVVVDGCDQRRVETRAEHCLRFEEIPHQSISYLVDYFTLAFFFFLYVQ